MACEYLHRAKGPLEWRSQPVRIAYVPPTSLAAVWAAAIAWHPNTPAGTCVRETTGFSAARSTDRCRPGLACQGQQEICDDKIVDRNSDRYLSQRMSCTTTKSLRL